MNKLLINFCERIDFLNKENVIRYMYFDAQEIRIKNRITDINNRLILSDRKMSEKDLIELFKLIIELTTYEKIEKHLHELIDETPKI